MTRKTSPFAGLRAMAIALAVGPAAAGSAVVLAGCGDAPPTLSAARATPSPTASLQDDRITQPAPGGAAQGTYVDERMRTMVDLGATLIRVDLRWDWVAPRRPAAPADPSDPAYDWTRYDPIVRAARRHGVEILFTAWSTPEWAVDPAVEPDPSDPPWGNRRPADPADFGAFAQAAAARYAPRGVHRWEAWNEPNIRLFLRPQYEMRDGRWVAVSPDTYTALLTAFRDGVRAADPDAVVAGGVTAPVGDPCGEACDGSGPEPNRIGPQQFIAALDAEGRRPVMDAYAHHPYPPGAPTGRPATRRIDMYNLADLPRATEGTYLADTPLWVTEYGIQTAPSQALKYAVGPQEQAAFIARAHGTLRDTPRIALGTYYNLQDNGAFNTGLLDLGGAEKPGASAYALPIAASPADAPSGARIVVNGQVRPATRATTVIVERRDGDRWVELARVRTLADGSWALGVEPHGPVTIRSRWSGRTRTGAAVERTGAELTLGTGGD